MPLPAQVAPSEKLSRFIFSSSHFSSHQRRVKYGAFTPPNQHRLELSVYRTDDLQEPEVWQLAVEHVETKNRKTKARADLICQNVLDLQLEVQPEPTRHYRHANITGWEEKDLKDLEFAVQLASKATLVIKP